MSLEKPGAPIPRMKAAEENPLGVNLSKQEDKISLPEIRGRIEESFAQAFALPDTALGILPAKASHAVKELPWNTIGTMLSNKETSEEMLSELAGTLNSKYLERIFDAGRGNHDAFMRMFSLCVMSTLYHDPSAFKKVTTFPETKNENDPEWIEQMNSRFTVFHRCWNAVAFERSLFPMEFKRFSEEVPSVSKAFMERKNLLNHLEPFVDVLGFGEEQLQKIYTNVMNIKDVNEHIRQLNLLFDCDDPNIHNLALFILNDYVVKEHFGFEIKEEDIANASTWASGSYSSVRRAWWRDSISLTEFHKRADKKGLSEEEEAIEVREQTCLLAQNLGVMLAVEEKIPGGVKLLYEKYRIRDFCRYPVDMLVEQVKNENSDVPYGILVCARNDYSLSILSDYKAFHELQESLEGRSTVRIFETESPRQLYSDLYRLDQTYGSQNKISFAIVDTHSNHESIVFDKNIKDRRSTPKEIGDDRNYSQIRQDHLKEEFSGRVQSVFKKEAPIVVLGCGTGKEGGIAQGISSFLKTKVTAISNESTFIDHLRVVYPKDGNKEVSIELKLKDPSAMASYHTGEKTS